MCYLGIRSIPKLQRVGKHSESAFSAHTLQLQFPHDICCVAATVRSATKQTRRWGSRRMFGRLLSCSVVRFSSFLLAHGVYAPSGLDCYRFVSFQHIANHELHLKSFNLPLQRQKKTNRACSILPPLQELSHGGFSPSWTCQFFS